MWPKGLETAKCWFRGSGDGCKWRAVQLAYKKENSGLSDTRNFGLNYADGEYITFVDSDDYIEPRMYEKMYYKAKEGNYDIVACDINYVYPNRNERIIVDPKKDTINNKELFINLYPTVCTKIFKRELSERSGLRFKSGVWYEDVEFMYRLLPYIASFGVYHEPFYNYIQREKSITSSVSPKIYDYVHNFNGLVEYYKNNNFYDNYRKELEYAYVRYIYATFIKTCLAYNKKDYLEAVDVAKRNVREYFPKYRRNIYFYKSKKGLYLLMFNKLLARILYLVRSK